MAQTYFGCIRSQSQPKKNLPTALPIPSAVRAEEAVTSGNPISWRCGTWFWITPSELKPLIKKVIDINQKAAVPAAFFRVRPFAVLEEISAAISCWLLIP